jgi:carbamoyl-phosphate synthase small subunit
MTGKRYLVLENGKIFEGEPLGAPGEEISEIVFTTSMTAYLETLTDPSYKGQAVVQTFPLIGNYGVCEDDMQSDQAWPEGFIVHEISDHYSNFRSHSSIQSFLLKHNTSSKTISAPSSSACA